MAKRAFRTYRGMSGTGMRKRWDVPLETRNRQRQEARMTKTAKCYHSENLKLQPYPHDAVIELAEHAANLGVQFKINGIPFGADYDRKLWDEFEPRTASN